MLIVVRLEAKTFENTKEIFEAVLDRRSRYSPSAGGIQ